MMMLNKFYTTPLDEDQYRKIHELMEKLESLADITREATIYRVVNCLLEDRISLEQYLTGIAGLITKQRDKISCRKLIGGIYIQVALIENELDDYEEDTEVYSVLLEFRIFFQDQI